MPNSYCGISIDAIKAIAVFKIGDKLFSLDLDYLTAFLFSSQETEKQVTVLPQENTVIYKGDFYRLINLHSFFGLKLKPRSGDTPLIAFEFAGHKGAFYADSIEEIITFTRMVKDTVKVIPPANGGFDAGELVVEGSAFIIPDFKKIFAAVN